MTRIAHLTLTLCLLSGAGQAFAQFARYQSKDTYASLNLNGRVRSVEMTCNSLSDDPWTRRVETDTNQWFGHLYVFDERGNCTEYAHYLYKDTEGKVVTDRTLTIYNEHNHIIEERNYDEGDVLASVKRISYEYDAQGRMLKAVISTENYYGTFTEQLEVQKTYTYNEDKTVREETIDLNDPNLVKSVDLYTAEGYYADYAYVIRRVIDHWGRTVSRRTNQHGLLVEESYEQNDTVWKTLYFTYDGNRNVIEQKEVNFYPHLSSTSFFVYDDRNNNNILETNYDYENKFLSQYKSAYDEHNNLIRTTHMKNERRIDFEIFYDLTYDKYGNWITQRRTPTTENLGAEYSTRTISYYE